MKKKNSYSLVTLKELAKKDIKERSSLNQVMVDNYNKTFFSNFSVESIVFLIIIFSKMIQ